MSRQHTHNNDNTFAEAAQWALKNLDENGKVKERPDRSWSNMAILCVVIGVILYSYLSGGSFNLDIEEETKGKRRRGR